MAPAEGASPPVPPEYLAEHVRDALATDRRVNEQGLEVVMVGTSVVVRGCVPTAALRDAVTEVAHEIAPDAVIVNDVEVPPNPEPDGSEHIE